MKAAVWFLACAVLAGNELAHAQTTTSPQPKAADSKPEGDTPKPSKPKQKHAKKAPTAADAKPEPAEAKPVVAVTPVAPPPTAAEPPKPACALAEAEQPRGGRLEVLSDAFGKAPVVRIAGRPARMIERREDRVSVQVPADSDGGPITLLHDGRSSSCGNLVIIGKNR